MAGFCPTMFSRLLLMDSMGCVSEFSEDLKELGRSQLNVERSSLWTMDYGLWLYNVDDLFIVTSINIQRINMLYECPTQYYNVAPPVM